MTKKFKIVPPKKIKIVETPGKGLGVVATATIKKGEIIEHAPIIFLSDNDAHFGDTDSDFLKHYILELTDIKKDCLMLGYGSIYNHSLEPNADIYYPEKDFDRYVIFKALKDIAQGEEITFDYEFADNKEEFLDLK